MSNMQRVHGWLNYVKVLVAVLCFLMVGEVHSQQEALKPEDLQFRRQAVRRILFDESQRLALSGMNPAKVIGLELMYPELSLTANETEFSIQNAHLHVKAKEQGVNRRWIGGFNVFASYDMLMGELSGSGEFGLLFKDAGEETYISAHVVGEKDVYQSVVCRIVKRGEVLEEHRYELPESLNIAGSFVLRVQMLAVGANVYVEQAEQLHLLGRFDFVAHFDLRRKDLMQQFEYCLETRLEAGTEVQIGEVSAYLSPGMGQSDLRIVTYEDGSPYFYEDRLWLLITVRGGGLPHPMQGVYSLDPSLFDVQFEGIILYDRADGLWRNDLASSIFYDRNAGEWRGFTTGFSSYGDPSGKEKKEILAVHSLIMPLKGISVMKAKSIGLVADYEDPQCLYDADAGKWRMLLCENYSGYKAVIRESDTWDGKYEVIAGPVSVNSTGTQLQYIGDKLYAFFGSADRKIYIYTYPDLQFYGELGVHRPPWTGTSGTRVWPNIIQLPEGYMHSYIALMMDRYNFPGMHGSNWTYGAMYLYHGIK